MFHRQPLKVDLERFKEEVRDQEKWTSCALDWYHLWYNTMGEYTKEECYVLAVMRDVLGKNMPKHLVSGVHLLAPNAADMGEDIYVVDGEVAHTLHMQHKLCEKYSLLSRKCPSHEVRMDRPSIGIYCAECKTWANRIDCV